MSNDNEVSKYKIDNLIATAWKNKYKDIQKSIEFSEKAYKLSESISYQRGKGFSLRNLAVFDIMNSNFQSALERMLKAMKIFDELEEILGKANALNILGILYKELGDYPKALEYSFQSLRICEDIDNRKEQATVFSNMANIYELSGNYEKALEFNLKSLEIILEFDDKQSESHLYTNIGNAYLGLKNFKKALSYYRLALKNFEQLEDERDKAIALNNIGNAYCYLEDGEKALEYLNQSLEIKKKLEDKLGQMHSLHFIGIVYKGKNKLDTAIDYLKRALRIAEAAQAKSYAYDINQTLSEAYQQAGDFKQALLYHKRFHDIKEQVFNEKADAKMKNLRVIHQVEKMEREARIYRLKNEKLEAEIEYKNNELTFLALMLAQKNKFMIQLKEEIIKEKETVKADLKPLFDKYIDRINENLDVNRRENWSILQEHFHNVHPDFLQTLSERYPDLTPAELRVCSLLKINLSTKEIAQVLSLTYKTIESHRYHIRKKLELSSNINLTTFMLSI